MEGYDPARVGVVGPNQTGDGDTGILTYEFVHRTHVDIFGFHYPHLFTDWWGDTWITNVYKPNRSTKYSEVYLVHTLALGRRYIVDDQIEKYFDDQVERGITVINRYAVAV